MTERVRCRPCPALGVVHGSRPTRNSIRAADRFLRRPSAAVNGRLWEQRGLTSTRLAVYHTDQLVCVIGRHGDAEGELAMAPAAPKAGTIYSLEILRTELVRAMQLSGCADAAGIGSTIVRRF